MPERDDKIICQPIGFIRTDMKVRFDTPRQPEVDAEQRNVIELIPGHDYELGLVDLAGFERIWLVWWFDRNPNWRPMVRAPRGDTRRRGVFATRSPHRPNPIGISCVSLLEVRKSSLVVGATDLLDGTPILDIKPYISEVDSFPNQRQGWLEDVQREPPLEPRFTVECSDLAKQQLLFLEREFGINFAPKVFAILSVNPARSRRNRITSAKDGVQRISSGVWRVFFSVIGDKVEIHRVAAGFPLELLNRPGREVIPDYQAQIAFEELFKTVYDS
jgi:tRNA-Thr(GGU) m(6)t(6)A37 methyltransferase TsaA